MIFRADRRAAAVVPLASIMLAGCLGGGSIPGTGDPLALARSAPAPAQPEAWPGADDCREAVLLAAEAVAANRVPPDGRGAPVRLLELDGSTGVALRRDLPLPAAGAATADETPCLLVVRPDTPLRSEQVSLGRRAVLSEYQSGSKVITNPQYTEAQRLLRQMEREQERGSQASTPLQATGEIAMDVLALAGTGLIGGVASLWEHGRKEEARQRLEDVPPTLEQPSYTTYRMSVEDVRASRSAGVRLAVVDREAGRVWELRRQIDEERDFALADGLHTRDREVAEGRKHYDQPPALHRWLQQPVELTTSDALRLMAAELRIGEGEDGDLAELVRTWRSTPAAPAQPLLAAAPASTATALPEPAAGPAVLVREVAVEQPVPPDLAPSVVAVHGMGGKGAGVYVGENRILTSRSLMGSSSMIEIRTHAGEVIYGMLERLDPQRDLALVRVQRAGPPVHVAAGAAAGEGAPPAGAAATGPGTPLVRGGELVGLVVHEEAGQNVDGGEIAAFLGAAAG